MPINAAKLTQQAAGVAAVEFLDLAFNERKVKEAFERYAAPPYTQHNPQVADGIDGALAALPGLLQAMPGVGYDIRRVLVDGDLVAVHSHMTNGADRGMAVVDLFRVADGKLVEHWDVIQPIPEEAANGNGMV